MRITSVNISMLYGLSFVPSLKKTFMRLYRLKDFLCVFKARFDSSHEDTATRYDDGSKELRAHYPEALNLTPNPEHFQQYAKGLQRDFVEHFAAYVLGNYPSPSETERRCSILAKQLLNVLFGDTTVPLNDDEYHKDLVKRSVISFRESDLFEMVKSHLQERGLCIASLSDTGSDVSPPESTGSGIQEPASKRRRQNTFSPVDEFTENYASLAPRPTSSGSFIPVPFHERNVSPCSLVDILDSYCRALHAACKHPLVYPPPFLLGRPHQCPSPIYTRASIVSHLHNRDLGSLSRLTDKKAHMNSIHLSKVRRIARYDSVDYVINSCAFHPQPSKIFVAGECNEAYGGYLGMYDYETKKFQLMLTSELAPIESVSTPSTQFSSDLLLSGGFCVNESREVILWRYRDHQIEELTRLSSKLGSANFHPDGTVFAVARLSCVDFVDTSTLSTFISLNAVLDFNSPGPVFSPNPRQDQLVMLDRTLWDLRSGSIVHRYDYLSESLSCTFHPDGNSLILDDQIWDTRHHRTLLTSVPELTNLSTVFSSNGERFYAYDRKYRFGRGRRSRRSAKLLVFDSSYFTKLVLPGLDQSASVNFLTVRSENDDFACIGHKIITYGNDSKGLSIYSPRKFVYNTLEEYHNNYSWHSYGYYDDGEDDIEDDYSSFQDWETGNIIEEESILRDENYASGSSESSFQYENEAGEVYENLW